MEINYVLNKAHILRVCGHASAMQLDINAYANNVNIGNSIQSISHFDPAG